MSSQVSAGPSPRNTSMLSSISSALPMQRPIGWFMSVISAEQGTPFFSLTETSASASDLAWSKSAMKAPAPNLTSRTKASSPSLSFFDRMEATINGIELTVAVTSRRA